MRAGLPSVTAVAAEAVAATATFTFAAGFAFPNGNYRATLTGAGVTDVAGNALRENHVFDFFALTGDVNRDRSVNGTDFAILAGNFGKSGMAYAQGDLNGDGFVNGSDFALLAGNFGRTVPAPAALTAAKTSPETAALASPTLKHTAVDRHRRLAQRAAAKTQQQRQRKRKIP